MRNFPTPAACNHRIRQLATILSSICLSLIALQPAAAQTVREYVEAEARESYDKLLKEFGENKTLPPGYELQALLALSHYPELKSVRIRFMVDDVDIPLSSRPHWTSMLRSARNRTYLVVIDNNREGGRNALLLEGRRHRAAQLIVGARGLLLVCMKSIAWRGLSAPSPPGPWSPARARATVPAGSLSFCVPSLV